MNASTVRLGDCGPHAAPAADQEEHNKIPDSFIFRRPTEGELGRSGVRILTIGGHPWPVEVFDEDD